MIKISLLILVIYIIYYAVLIVHELFFKKEMSLEINATEEFTLTDSKSEIIQNVGIEDVETIKTPQSFSVNEKMDTDAYKKDPKEMEESFRMEQEIENRLEQEDQEERKDQEEINQDQEEINQDQEEINQDQEEINQDQEEINQDQEEEEVFKNLLNHAETSVRVIKRNGKNIYKSEL